MKKFDDGSQMAYIVSHEAWYGPSAVDGEEISIIRSFAKDGGCVWGFTIRWHELGNPGNRWACPRVQIFDDAWAAFTEVPELFAALSAANNHEHRRSPAANTPEQVKALLDELGYIDLTERER